MHASETGPDTETTSKTTNENTTSTTNGEAKDQDERIALGAVLGALVGDAAGAVLEFFRGTIREEDVTHALRMPGGGTWGVAPGQVTDDGELTMSLLHALAMDVAPMSPTERAARRYAAWVASRPFDIGSTTASALGCLRHPEHREASEREGAAPVMTRVASVRCIQSKANGSLMRATPLAVWGARQTADDTMQAVLRDARLSHPNDACVGAAVAYVMAIRHLILAPNDVRGAVAIAEVLARPFAEPTQWLRDARDGVVVPFTPQDGFVRIGFTHAFRHLMLGTSYLDALRETLLGGGDTDTNACIVGGLVGARVGMNGIPMELLTPVLEGDTQRGKNPRPDEYHPRHARSLVRELLHPSARKTR